MSKKKDNKVVLSSVGISARGKKIIALGIFIVIVGFFILTKTNPQGDNWASDLSPILIIGGYITIALGIIF